MTRRGLLCELSTGERFLVDKDRFVIGRDRRCDLQIPRGSISRRHILIERRDDRWWLSDLGSTSGIFVLGSRVAHPMKLAVDLRVNFGDEILRVLAFDHEAQPGEHTGPIENHLALECPFLICRCGIELRSMTGNVTAQAAVDAAILATGGSFHGDFFELADPVQLVLATQALFQLGETRPGGVGVRVRQHDLLIAGAALELLAEATVPARSAWRWLMRNSAFSVQVPPSLLRGLALDLESRPDTVPFGFTDELSGTGVVAWLFSTREGYLIQFDQTITLAAADADVVVKGFQSRAVRMTIEHTAYGWFAHAVPGEHSIAPEVRDQPLVVGTELELDGYLLRVVAIT